MLPLLKSDKRIATLLLAAGASNRFNGNKLTSTLLDTTVLEHSLNQLTPLNTLDIFVVAGCYYQEIRALISNEIVIQNSSWEEGIASSIRCGINHLLASNTNFDAVLISLADQVLLTTADHEKLLTHFLSSGETTAARYNNRIGVPAIFPQYRFTELLTLQGDIGARDLLQNTKLPIEIVEVPNAAFDIDTKEDIIKLTQKLNVLL